MYRNPKLCNPQPSQNSIFPFHFPFKSFGIFQKTMNLHCNLLSSEDWNLRGGFHETTCKLGQSSSIKVIIFVSKVPVTLASRGSCSAIFAQTKSEAEKHTLVSSSSEETLSSSVVDGSAVPESRWRKYALILRRQILIIR